MPGGFPARCFDHLSMKYFHHHRLLERAIATLSFFVAVALAFIALLISEENEIASGHLMPIAQFLTFSATLLGIDYKFSDYAQKKQDPARASQQ